MREINKIIIHCTATPEGREVTIEEITRWHKARGFRDIGYHYVIDLNGNLLTGRPEDEIGAHCRGENKNSIGIAYVGGLDNNGKAKDTRNDKQKNIMYLVVSGLLNKYEGSTLHTHNEFANKACPSFKMKDF